MMTLESVMFYLVGSVCFFCAVYTASDKTGYSFDKDGLKVTFRDGTIKSTDWQTIRVYDEVMKGKAE